MARHIRASRKGISPVIATVILVAVAITVAVSVAYWMGGISGLYTRLEKIEVSSTTVTKAQVANYTITLSVKNTGSADGTLDNVLINGKPYDQYSSPVTITVTYDPSTGLVAAGSTNTVTIAITQVGSAGTPPFTPGTTIDVKLHTAAGKDYPQMVTLT